MIKLRRRIALAGNVGRSAARYLPRMSMRRPVDFPDSSAAPHRRLPAPAGRTIFSPRKSRHRRARKRLKRSVVVENRAGANGRSPPPRSRRRHPDGSVIMLASNGSTTMAPALNRTWPTTSATRFWCRAHRSASIPCCWWCATTCRPKNVAELLALARAQPGKLNGASAGAGGATICALELVQVDGQGRHRARALQGRRAGHGRPDGGPGRYLFRRLVDGAAARQGRQDAGAGPDLARPLGRGARHSDHRGGRPAGLRGRHLLRHLPAGRRLAGSGRAPARRRGRHGAFARRRAQKFTDLGRRSPVRHALGVLPAYVAGDLAKWARLAKEAGLTPASVEPAAT